MTASPEPTDDALKDAAVDWFLRRSAAPLPAEEAQAFAEWLDASPANQEAYLAVDAFWSGAGQLETLSRFDAKRRQILKDIDRGRVTRRAGVLGAAALIAGLAGAGIYEFAAPKRLVTQSFQTAVGQQATVTLPDGSVVTLNTDTTVRTRADGERRLVYLDKGQAYFKVAKDKRHPFVVTAAGRTVTALGTAFDLRVDGRALKVVLLEGKVRVEAAGAVARGPAAPLAAKPTTTLPLPMRSTEMEPGSQLVALDDGDWRLSRANVTQETSWRRGKIMIDDQPLGEVVAELNRYSTRKIVIADQHLADQRISGIYEPGDIEEFARALRHTGLAELQEEGGGDLRIVALK
jgi:transmembrane sensor